jgi:hypothetical protein
MRSRLLIFIGTLALLAASLACGAGTATPLPPTETPTETLPPTETPLPPAPQVVLVSVPTSESGTAPVYTIDAQTPQFQGSGDPRLTYFNNLASLLTLEEIGVFKGFLIGLHPSPISVGSSYHQTYTLESPPGEVYSFKFVISTYIDGAAHPGTHSRTLTYDLYTGQQVQLEQLFKPGSPYLLLISEYCQAELSRRPIGFDQFATGADPTEANYGLWNITADGLLITFDEYQVAAYAAGPQEVVVPYAALQSAIAPSGLLGAYLP